MLFRSGNTRCRDVGICSSVYGFQSLSVSGALITGSARPPKEPIDPVKEIRLIPASAAWRVTLSVPLTVSYEGIQIINVVCKNKQG